MVYFLKAISGFNQAQIIRLILVIIRVRRMYQGIRKLFRFRILTEKINF